MAHNPSDKYGVSVTLESLQGEQRHVLQAAGEATVRGASLYIRYEEPGQGPRGDEPAVRTTLKLSGSELKLIRHGGVESEQTFASGRRLPGFYRSPYSQFNLSTDTRSLNVVREGRSLQISWEYDLYVYEELSGQFTISMQIQEETE